MSKMTALVTGTTGQDGSYLAEFLLAKGYRVIGLVRRSSVNTLERLGNCLGEPGFELVEGDVTDAGNMSGLIKRHHPDEVYNLAAMSHVGTSFEQPLATFQMDAVGPLNILEAIRHESPTTKFYQASTSELYGDTKQSPQNEHTRFRPASPYAVAKLAAHNTVGLYRQAYGLFACAGILFNHESPRRGENFVTRKITKYVAQLARTIQDSGEIPYLMLGNLDAKRDWGHAKDYVEAMWLMLQQDKPDDYVVATGETRTIREFLTAAFSYIGLDWKDYVRIDPACLRPADVNLLLGDASKAHEILGWRPRHSFVDLVGDMVLADMDAAGVDMGEVADRIRSMKAGETCHA